MPPDPAVGSDSDECVGVSSPSRVTEREVKVKLTFAVRSNSVSLLFSCKSTLFCKMYREI